MLAFTIRLSRLRKVLSKVMIRRGYASRIPRAPDGKLIAKELPPEENRMKHLECADFEADITIPWAKGYVSQRQPNAPKKSPFHNFRAGTFWWPLARALTMNKSDASVVSRTESRAALGTADISGHREKSLSDKQFIARGQAHGFLTKVYKDSPTYKKWLDAQGGLPDTEDIVGVIQCFTNFNPKLRYTLCAVMDLHLLQGLKILFWTSLAVEQEILRLVLAAIGLDVDVLASGMDIDERSLVQSSFRSTEGVKLLICNASLDFAGLNLQGSCSRQIFVSEPQSYEYERQQRGRIRRIGPQSIRDVCILSITLRVLRSYNEVRALAALQASLLPLGMQLNMKLFGSTTEGDKSNHEFGFVVKAGEDFNRINVDLSEHEQEAVTEGFLLASIKKMLDGEDPTLSQYEMDMIIKRSIPKAKDLTYILEQAGRSTGTPTITGTENQQAKTNDEQAQHTDPTVSRRPSKSQGAVNDGALNQDPDTTMVDAHDFAIHPSWNRVVEASRKRKR